MTSTTFSFFAHTYILPHIDPNQPWILMAATAIAGGAIFSMISASNGNDVLTSVLAGAAGGIATTVWMIGGIIKDARNNQRNSRIVFLFDSLINPAPPRCFRLTNGKNRNLKSTFRT